MWEYVRSSVVHRVGGLRDLRVLGVFRFMLLVFKGFRVYGEGFSV